MAFASLQKIAMKSFMLIRDSVAQVIDSAFKELKSDRTPRCPEFGRDSDGELLLGVVGR